MMTPFWAGWVIALVVFNLGITLFLFVWGLNVRIPVQPDGTTGHVWAHGTLREGVHRLPVWWIVMSAATYVGGIVYFILYPGFGDHEGTLQWTSHIEEARDTVENRSKLDPVLARFVDKPIAKLARDPAALRIGNRLFRDNCSACHGAKGHGNTLIGASDLTDRDSLYGNDGDTLLASITHGRRGVMPPWGAALGEDGVAKLTQYVLSLAGAEHDAAQAAAGKPLFATCSACHGAEGQGNPMLGAPGLTGPAWAYGGSAEQIAQSIRDGRSGVMPAWKDRLSPAELRAVAGWTYGLSNPSSAPR